MIKYINRIRIETVIQLVVGILSIYLCLHWFDWKLLVVLWLWTWSNNIMIKDK